MSSHPRGRALHLPALLWVPVLPASPGRPATKPKAGVTEPGRPLCTGSSTGARGLRAGASRDRCPQTPLCQAALRARAPLPGSAPSGVVLRLVLGESHHPAAHPGDPAPTASDGSPRPCRSGCPLLPNPATTAFRKRGAGGPAAKASLAAPARPAAHPPSARTACPCAPGTHT